MGAAAVPSLSSLATAARWAIVGSSKKAINGSVGRRIRDLYRQELSYTYELNLTSDAHDARETFVSGERKGYLDGR